MRIIAGELRRRRIQGPPDDKTTRPIPDRIKEAVFNLLRGHVEGQQVVDCFAGTGSIGLEAVSRGAAHVVFLEKDRRIAELLHDNIESLGAQDRCELVKADALGPVAIARCPQEAHLVFFDPPYRMLRDEVSRSRLLRQLALFIERLDDDGYAVLRTPWPLFEESQEEDEDAPPKSSEPIDLTLEGAEGPETHAYGQMAIHLYMRRRSIRR